LRSCFQLTGSEREKCKMEKISRYFLVFIAILTLAIVLPKLYWMAFEKPIRKPFVLFSCMNNDFMIHRIAEGNRVDTKGNKYTLEEYEQKLPMMFVQQLLVSGLLPDTIKGIGLDMHDISKAKSFFRLKANEIDAPVPDLYPMFESKSGRASLEMPDDFFRITWRIDFIDASTNKVLEDKSQMFSGALFHKGFAFPVKQIAGLPTTRKSCDEGYLILDSKDQLFHVKMIKGKPFVMKVNIPEGLKFTHINCVDFKNKSYYAYLFSEKNEIYILTQDDYQLVKWPIEGYNPKNCDLKIYGDLFNYNVIIEAEDHIKVFALDTEYKIVDTYSESWPVKAERTEGKVFASIFPAQLSMTSDKSKFIRFYLALTIGFSWVFLNLLLLAIHFIFLYRRKVNLKKHIADLCIIAITGIFGFIAIHFFQNKFFE